MNKGHYEDKNVTGNYLKHGTKFYGYWIYIIYKLSQQLVASGAISKNNSDRTRPYRWKGEEQKLSIKDKKILKSQFWVVCVCRT